jgi:polyisoprenoid-binding protein YceI
MLAVATISWRIIMSTTTAVNLPTGTWAIDPAHSAATFSVRHLMVSKVRGRFTSFSGTISVPDDPFASTVEATIDVASIDTHDAGRDEHLRSGDFLEIDTYPTITFRSTGVRGDSPDDLVLVGDLTIRGVTRSVDLALEFNGVAADPWGGTRAGFSATTEVSRKDFGMEWNVALETGGFVVGDKVKIELEVEAIKQ